MRLRPSTFCSVFAAAALLQGCQDFNDLKAALKGAPDAPAQPAQPSKIELRTGFLGWKGAPSFAATTADDVTAFDLAGELPDGVTRVRGDISVQKGYPTPDDPHRQLGMVLLNAETSQGAPFQSKVLALRREAAKHGANAIVFKGCKSDRETCAAVAFHLSSSAPEAAKAPTDKEIVDALRAQLPPGTVITTNQNAADDAGPPAPGSKAAIAAGDEALATIAKDKPSKTAVANNKALSKALIAIWMPDASGTTSERARADLERELVRSMVYVDTTGGHVKLTQDGLVVVYTDEKSAPPKSKVVAVPAARLLELMAPKNVGIYLHHEGEASVFTGIRPEDIRAIIAQAGKSTSTKR